MLFRPWPLTALFTLVLLTPVACSDSNSGSSTMKAQIPVTANLATGRISYEAGCLGCHGVAGDADTNCAAAAPSSRPGGAAAPKPCGTSSGSWIHTCFAGGSSSVECVVEESSER